MGVASDGCTNEMSHIICVFVRQESEERIKYQYIAYAAVIIHLSTYLVPIIGRGTRQDTVTKALHYKPSLPNRRKRSQSQLPSYFLSLQTCNTRCSYCMPEVNITAFIRNQFQASAEGGARRLPLHCERTAVCARADVAILR
ncbi:unnamed protein product [Danaus chrysippus]|uniref:(African queen) hypothetical protein n=1 Tax=Danaus chrysippus TaxID=151541 RepID=A0A8J2QT01_9NEOP|nr:unnamed protein product [Danaus chrysippus]